MKPLRITLGILSLFAIAACERPAPLSPEKSRPNHDGGFWTIGAGAVEPPPATPAADTTSRGGFWTIGAGD